MSANSTETANNYEAMCKARNAYTAELGPTAIYRWDDLSSASYARGYFDALAVLRAVQAEPIGWISEQSLRFLQHNATAGIAPKGMRLDDEEIPVYLAAALAESVKGERIEPMVFASREGYVALPQGWISVEDRLPPAQRMVLMACPTSQRAAVQYGFFDFAQREFMTGTAGGWEPVRYTGKPVTHWMELPAAPSSQESRAK